jgi:transposase
LATECGRNLEVMWLLKGLCPSYHTIADFRKANAKALVAVNRDFIALCRELGLFGGERVGLDGSFFHGNASDASIQTNKQLETSRRSGR